MLESDGGMGGGGGRGGGVGRGEGGEGGRGGGNGERGRGSCAMASSINANAALRKNIAHVQTTRQHKGEPPMTHTIAWGNSSNSDVSYDLQKQTLKFFQNQI